MKIFLAAIATGGMPKDLRERVIKECKPRYVLESIYNGEKTCDYALQISSRKNFLLDSGAFSFMNGATVSKSEFEAYVDRYIYYIKSRDIPYFFEMDVDCIFGLNQVEKWRRKIELETNKQCIPVWHKSRGVEYWKNLCADYNYIAIGGFAIKDIKPTEYPIIQKLLIYANNKGVKVHGLGFTKKKILGQFPFYSVDSSTWITSVIRGSMIQLFNGKTLVDKSFDGQGNKLDLPKMEARNLVEWTKYQKYMDVMR